MKLSNIRRVSREDLKDAPAGDWIDQFLVYINQANEQYGACLNGRATIGDNMQAKIITHSLTNATLAKVVNPLGSIRPVGCSVINSDVTPAPTVRLQNLQNGTLGLTATYPGGGGPGNVTLIVWGG